MNCEMSKKEKCIKLIVGLLLFLVTVGTIYYVNLLYPFCMDDDWYATLLYSDEKIKNLLDVFDAQKWHYMNWGGRSITHSMLQLTILAGDSFANIANTFMIIVSAVIIVFIAEMMTRKKECFVNRILYIDGVMGLMLGLNANWQLTMFWQSGAANYLWITIFVLLIIGVYMREIPYDCFGSKEPLWSINVWIIPLALIAGWSNENIGPVVFLFSIATIIYVRKVGHVVQPWMILGSVFSFLGSVMCILAPGNFVRAENVTSKNYGLLWKAYLRCFYESRGIFNFLFISILVTVFLIAMVKGVCSQKLGREVVYLLVAALLSWGAMVLSPHFPDRASYGTMIFLILADVAMTKNILEKKPNFKAYIWIPVLLIWGKGMYYLTQYIGITLGWLVD